jgi:hypothetical protein
VPPETIVDMNGAGDAFVGGFLSQAIVLTWVDRTGGAQNWVYPNIDGALMNLSEHVFPLSIHSDNLWYIYMIYIYIYKWALENLYFSSRCIESEWGLNYCIF